FFNSMQGAIVAQNDDFSEGTHSGEVLTTQDGGASWQPSGPISDVEPAYASLYAPGATWLLGSNDTCQVHDIAGFNGSVWSSVGASLDDRYATDGQHACDTNWNNHGLLQYVDSQHGFLVFGMPNGNDSNG